MRLYMQNNADDGKESRFYQLLLQPDLISGWTLIRETGYQGKTGRVQQTHYDSHDEAIEALMEWRDKQIKRGFQIVYMKGMDKP